MLLGYSTRSGESLGRHEDRSRAEAAAAGRPDGEPGGEPGRVRHGRRLRAHGGSGRRIVIRAQRLTPLGHGHGGKSTGLLAPQGRLGDVRTRRRYRPQVRAADSPLCLGRHLFRHQRPCHSREYKLLDFPFDNPENVDYLCC